MTWHDAILIAVAPWTLFVLCAGIAIGHRWGLGRAPRFMPDLDAVKRSLQKSKGPIVPDEPELKPDEGRYQSERMAGR